MVHKHLAIIVLLGLTTCSCVPTFRHALPQPKPLVVDEEVAGSWFWHSEDGPPGRLSIVPRRTGWFDLVMTTREEDGGPVETLHFEGYSAQVNGEKYLCLREPPRRKNGKLGRLLHTAPEHASDLGFMLEWYEVRDGKLHTRALSEEAVVELVTSGRLAGEVFEGRYGKTVRVFASGSEVASVLAREGIHAFDKDNEEGVLTRSPAGGQPRKRYSSTGRSLIEP